jgi:chromosome segregation ATPase
VFADYLIPLSIATIVAAGVCVALAIFAWRRLSEGRIGLAGLAERLDGEALTLTQRLSTARASLAEQGAAIEHTLWTMRRFDEQVDALTISLRERRKTLNELQQTLKGARVGIERLKAAVRLIVRAIELRRAILG